jgi:addiction module HigA family antidote
MNGKRGKGKDWYALAPHPGAILRQDIIFAENMTLKQAAHELGVKPVKLSRIVSGKAPVTLEMALRLERWREAMPAERWLRLQLEYDLGHADALRDKVGREVSAHQAGGITEDCADGTLGQDKTKTG